MTRNPHSPGAAPAQRPASDDRLPARFVVPRAWFALLAALIVVPWLVAAVVYLWPPADAERPAQTEPVSGASPAVHPGPWGALSVSPIVISPPLEYVASDWGRSPRAGTEWVFPSMPAEALEPMLRSVGFGPEQVARLRAVTRLDPRIGGVVVTPGDEFVRSLSPDVRGRLYVQLAKIASNYDQVSSFRFLGESAESWLNGSLISPPTRALVEPLLYRDGAMLHFSDVGVVRSHIRDEEELRRLAKVLLRQRTVLVRLTVDDTAEVGRLAEYWGRGGRSTDLRPLLESVAGGGDSRRIDIVHLLPAFARNRLYRFPKVTAGDMDKPILANCAWTALNFFSQEPDDRFMDLGVALDTLRRDYYVVQSQFQLGDVVAFLDEQGNLFHVGVYLADDLIFSKNGTSPVSPWVIQTLGDLEAYYRVRCAKPRLIYHRRNDF